VEAGEPETVTTGDGDCVEAGEPETVTVGDGDCEVPIEVGTAVGDGDCVEEGEPEIVTTGDGDCVEAGEPETVTAGDGDCAAVGDGEPTEGDGYELGLMELSGSTVVVVLAITRSSTWPTSESERRSHQASKAPSSGSAWLSEVDITGEEGGYCQADGTGEGGGAKEAENGVWVSGEAESSWLG
jgi:hypothetical protein